MAFILLLSCKNDLEKIRLFEEEAMVPDLSGNNVTMLRSDSGKLIVRVFAPEIKRYDQVEEPYTEFPTGVKVYFLDSLQQVKSSITAKYAIRYNQQNLYYARDSVVAKNEQTGEWIKSEEMYWDEKTGKVYSNKFTTIQRTDGLFHGRGGFRSSQDFTDWVLIKPTGNVKFYDDKKE